MSECNTFYLKKKCSSRSETNKENIIIPGQNWKVFVTQTKILVHFALLRRIQSCNIIIKSQLLFFL